MRARGGMLARMGAGARMEGRLKSGGEIMHGAARIRGQWNVLCRRLAPDVAQDLRRARASETFARGMVLSLTRELQVQRLETLARAPLRFILAQARVDVDALQRWLGAVLGETAWVEAFENIVVNQGLDDLLSITLAGGTQDTTWFIGLKGSGAPAAADTLASHAGWSELTPYSGNRLAWTAGAVAAQSVSNSGSPAAFAITSGTTVVGSFLSGVNTGTSGRLYAAGDFASSRAVISGDTLTVTATFTTADDGV